MVVVSRHGKVKYVVMSLSKQAQQILRSLPDPQDMNKTGVDRLFQAVLCLLVERGADLVASALQPGDVTDRAGKARSGYYRTPGFPSEDAVLGEVDRSEVLVESLDRAVNGFNLDEKIIVTGVRAYLAGLSEHASFRDALEMILRENYGVGSPAFTAYLMTGSLATSSEGACAVLNRYYAYVTGTYDQILGEVMARFGLRPLPPFESREVVTIVSALHDGLAMRGLVDDRIDKDLYARAGLLVFGSLLAVTDDSDQIATELDPAGDVRSPTTKTRHQIVEEVRRFLADHAPAVPTLETLGRVVSCGPETLSAMFGGLLGLLEEVWRDLLPPVYDAHHRDRSTGKLGTGAQLRAHLVRLGDLIDANASLAAALIRLRLSAALDATRTGRTVGDPSVPDEILEELVTRFRDEGGVDVPGLAGRDAEEVVRDYCERMMSALIETILVRGERSGLPGADVDECVSYIWDVFFGA